MKKQCLLFIVFTLSFFADNHAQAPNCAWSKGIGSTGSDARNAVTVDGSRELEIKS
jgi:hypothetical protein